jgi:ABC-type branched-subunit amino acid transport system substrate-binding protein
MTRRMLAWLGFTLLGIALVQPAAAQKKAPEAALAQAEVSGGVVRLGVLTDETGVLSSASGEGSIEAARMAVEDFGSKAAGRPIEIIHADHQNKTDIGAAIARRWIDVDGVDAIVDVPNSAIALAVQELAKEKNRVLLVSTAATVDLTGKACSPVGVHWTWDTLRSCGQRRQGDRAAGRRQLVLPDRGFCLRPCDAARRHPLHRGERRQGDR